MRKGEEKGLTNGALAAALGVIEQVPFARETVDVGKASENIKSGSGSDAVGGLVGDMVVPTGISWLARQIDTDRNGDPIKRKPHGFLETIKAGIPGLRSQRHGAIPCHPGFMRWFTLSIFQQMLSLIGGFSPIKSGALVCYQARSTRPASPMICLGGRLGR
jgi:hypothetical protein